MLVDLVQFSNLLVMPFWALMILVPHWDWTRRVAESLWIVVPAALMYTVLVIPKIPQLLPELLQPTAEGVAGLMAEPATATVVWVHILAFDLLVGRWAYLDSRRRGVSPWLVSPVLLWILMFGPFGLLIYAAVAYGWSSRRSAPAAA